MKIKGKFTKSIVYPAMNETTLTLVASSATIGEQQDIRRSL
jgi:hypothetical protein